LRLLFTNSSEYTVDYSEFLKATPALAPLRNAQAFKSAVVDEWGWVVKWPELDIQIGADTLWLDALAQNAPDESTRFFAGWRSRNGLSLKQVADALGVTTRTVTAYGTGSRPVPKTVQLACIGWEYVHKKKAA